MGILCFLVKFVMQTSFFFPNYYMYYLGRLLCKVGYRTAKKLLYIFMRSEGTT